MIKYDGAKEELRKTLTTLKSFRLNASPAVFNEIFGEDKNMGEQLWHKYLYDKNIDLIAFWGYLDEAHQEVFLKYLLKSA